MNSPQGISQLKRTIILLCMGATVISLPSCNPKSHYDRGYKAGVERGYSIGYTAGTTAGYAAGEKAGYENGHRVGFADGKDEGTKLGYISGQKAFLTKTWMPSMALGICAGLGLLMAYLVLILLRYPARQCGLAACAIAQILKMKLLSATLKRQVLYSLRRQQIQLRRELMSEAKLAAATELALTGLGLTHAQIQTRAACFASAEVVKDFDTSLGELFETARHTPTLAPSIWRKLLSRIKALKITKYEQQHQ
jgi:hypothetical protein